MAGDNRFKTLHHTKRVALILVTAALGFFPQVNAQPVDPLLDEGVQILIEKHEIVHLQKIGQLDPDKAQERLQATKQRWDKLSQKIGQWPKEKQRAFTEELKKRSAAAKAPLDQKWDTEARQLQKDGSAQAGQESVSTATPAQADSGGARPVGQSQGGPDILGLRIGMSLAEARAVVKAHPKPKYHESIGQLEYSALESSGEAKNIAISRQFVSVIASHSPKKPHEQASDLLIIYFTLEHGAERVASVMRSVTFDKDKPLLETEVMKALTEKYGNPAARVEQGIIGTLWRFKGQPTSTLGLHDEALVVTCKSMLSHVYDEREGTVSNWALEYRQSHVVEDLERRNTRCGGEYVFFAPRSENPSAPATERFLSGYQVELVGPALGLGAMQEMEAMRRADKEKRTRLAIDRAKSQAKPDF